MLALAMWWILVVSGVVTAVAGLPAVFLPRQFLGLAFGVEDAGAATTFFVRHWGVLIFVVGALVVCAASQPAIRTPVLVAAAVEKLVIVALIFFGPLRRTPVMTVIALADGTFAVLYVAYLAGL
jgi:hypothetical protein